MEKFTILQKTIRKDFEYSFAAYGTSQVNGLDLHRENAEMTIDWKQFRRHGSSRLRIY